METRLSNGKENSKKQHESVAKRVVKIEGRDRRADENEKGVDLAEQQ